MNLQLQWTLTFGAENPSFWNKTHNKFTFAAINEGLLNLYFYGFSQTGHFAL